MNTITTELPSIPDIAELIRLHTHRSNDTARLVAEYILPILGVELEKPSDLANLGEQLDNTRTMEADVLDTHAAIKEELQAAYEALAEHDRATDGLPADSPAPEDSTLDDYHGDLVSCREHAWTTRQCLDAIGNAVKSFESSWDLQP